VNTQCDNLIHNLIQVAASYANDIPVPSYKTEASSARDALHHDVVASFLAVEGSDGDPIDTTAAIRSWLVDAHAKVVGVKGPAAVGGR
jgi:hypothetical protein